MDYDIWVKCSDALRSATRVPELELDILKGTAVMQAVCGLTFEAATPECLYNRMSNVSGTTKHKNAHRSLLIHD